MTRPQLETRKQLILPVLAAAAGVEQVIVGSAWIGVAMLVGSAVLALLIVKPKGGRKLSGLGCVALVAVFAMLITTACEETPNLTPQQIGYSTVRGQSFPLVVQEQGSIASNCVIDVLTTGTMVIAAAAFPPSAPAAVFLGWTLVGLNGAATINDCLASSDGPLWWASSRFLANCSKSNYLTQDVRNGNWWNALVNCALIGWGADLLHQVQAYYGW